MVPTSWTTIDYGIRPVGATAVTDRTDRHLVRRRGCCTDRVRNPCLSGLPIVKSITIRIVRREIDRRGNVDTICTSQKSVSCTGRSVNWRVSVLDAGQGGVGYARMMHYPGRNGSVPGHLAIFRAVPLVIGGVSRPGAVGK